MKTKRTAIANQTINFQAIALVTAGVLMIPLIAMQFTREVNWTFSDFLIMGTLVFGTGTLFDWATKTFHEHKFIVAAAILFAFLLIWAELAVGIFGSPIAGS